MTAIDEARAQLRARPAKAQPEAWSFPAWGDFAQHLNVLVFDATLSHCGWAYMRAWKAGIDIIDKGCISPETTLTGYLETWEKMRRLGVALFGEVSSYAARADAVVVEAPSVGGGYRKESSLIAGGTICVTFPPQERRAFAAVSATHVSAVLLGNAHMPSVQRKKAIRETVIRLVPEASERTYNEHIRDAIATGATYLIDRKRRESESEQR